MITPPSRIAFIGLGVMGRSMALNLLKAGYVLNVYTRTRASADAVIAAGATWCDTPAAACADARAVITIVGVPADVREVYFGDNGLLAAAAPGTTLIDMTTSEPQLAVEITETARQRGLHAIDAPVSGGDIGAKNGTLSIMIGGEKDMVTAAQPLFDVLGETIVHQGPAGSGQHAKMCNQITIASTMVGIMESLIYATRSGLDPRTVLQSIGAGAAASWGLNNLWPLVIDKNYDPGFYICHFLKDIRIALDEAARLKLDLPGLRLAEERYQACVDLGLDQAGTQALYQVYD